MNDRSLQWSNAVQASAQEIQLLAGGKHLNKPNAETWITIGVKPKTGDNRDWNLAALPIHDGTEYLPNFIEAVLAPVIDEDAYNSINSFFKAGTLYGKHQYTHHQELKNVRTPTDGNQLRAGYRSSDGVARLNACFVDIDYYHHGLTAGNVIGQIYDLQNEGKIPPPTYLKDSGRGLWACWLLGLEPRSYSEHVKQYNAIQAKLRCMFGASGGDANATDAARLTRIIGSNNSTVNRRANMVIFARDTDGQPIRYRLADLAEAFNCTIQKRTRTTDPILKLAPSAKAVKGQIERWRIDEKRFWTLVETIRKTVPEGTRNAHNLVLGSILRQRYRSRDELAALTHIIPEASERLWKRYERSRQQGKSDYPLNRVIREVTKAVYGKKAGVRITAKTIANRLLITTAEAEQLRDLVPTNSGGFWPPADGQPSVLKELNRNEKKQRIQEWLIANNFVTSPIDDRTLAAIISERLGISVSHETVRQYRKQLAPPKPKAEPSHTQPTLLES